MMRWFRRPRAGHTGRAAAAAGRGGPGRSPAATRLAPPCCCRQMCRSLVLPARWLASALTGQRYRCTRFVALLPPTQGPRLLVRQAATARLGAAAPVGLLPSQTAAHRAGVALRKRRVRVPRAWMPKGLHQGCCDVQQTPPGLPPVVFE